MADQENHRRAVAVKSGFELAACPFCGSTDVGFYEHVYSKQFAVMCNACSAEGPRRVTLDAAQQLWNHRAPA